MFFGGHVRHPEDIDFLQALEFDFGEVVIRDKASRALWSESNVRNMGNDTFFLLAHGPHEGPPNDPKNLWNIYVPALIETIDIAHGMNITLLTIHMWVDHRFVKRTIIEEKKNALRQVVDFGRQRNVSVSLENLSESAADIEAVLAVVPDLVLTLDVGHGQLLAKTNTSFEIIERLGPFIRHVHLHDNRGGKGVEDDLHLPIGEGVIDFHGILGLLKHRRYDGTMTLELERHSLEEGRRTVQRFLDNL
ncbi:sugar phosphate isomerase/epimerase family protein [Desulfomonile tiedjei]|uniref:Sugar phosphate isomerase/epimerase n=1 Tax=Desulfomonile tiedjei (strain ATCC 49306 / DSM 6799 / DCB-1) TaxID=706587 RepID=I4C6R7_DESTA|nr:sugar phosphate isomerase/epimerase family protein [Desulfomonile tiedjei]AFM25258.1 sugar phosphate isomerase/epimerase [Desulfomonile tiedjei DSM 6799]